jgi:hypothetical protein
VITTHVLFYGIEENRQGSGSFLTNDEEKDEEFIDKAEIQR